MSAKYSLSLEHQFRSSPVRRFLRPLGCVIYFIKPQMETVMSGPGSGGGNDWRPEPAKPAPKSKGDDKGGGGKPVPPDPCNITEVTTLNSVNRNVIAGLRPNDRLAVVFQAGPPQRLVAERQPGVIAGSITSPSMLQIIQCIQAGHNYDAVVLSVRGAQCQVRIEPR